MGRGLVFWVFSLSVPLSLSLSVLPFRSLCPLPTGEGTHGQRDLLWLYCPYNTWRWPDRKEEGNSPLASMMGCLVFFYCFTGNLRGTILGFLFQKSADEAICCFLLYSLDFFKKVTHHPTTPNSGNRNSFLIRWERFRNRSRAMRITVCQILLHLIS